MPAGDPSDQASVKGAEPAAAPKAEAGPGLALTTPLEEVRALTPRVAEKLRELGLRNVGQLVAHLPMRHEHQEAESPMADLVAGRVVSARGEVTATRVVRGRRPRFEAVLCDETGRLDLVWFNATYLHSKVHPGMRLRVQGKANSRTGGVQLANPKFEILAASAPEPEARDSRLRPVYPASEEINSTQIEAALAKVLPGALPLIEDHLPEAFRTPRELPALADAYRMMHAPSSAEEAAAGRRRLAYDELLLLQIGLFLKRVQHGAGGAAIALRWSAAIDEAIRGRFPFTLTKAQDVVIRELAADLQTTRPANRLIQGDVGAGKTVVALYAMLMAVASRHQAALMAPTELLAEQHFASMGRMLEGSPVKLAILTGQMPERARRDLLEAMAEGRIDIVVGTHALLTEQVAFKSLAVVVIDEQHRFGVHQRARLRAKGAGPHGVDIIPHTLVMTATPIPRTLAMTLFGDLDVSSIKALPPGRKPVKTRVVKPEMAGEVYTWLRTRLEKGEQAYIVAPAIDPTEDVSGSGSLASVRELHERLERGPLAGLRLAVLHGQLSGETRDVVMGRFRMGLIDALIATTVIEVGVDVPNATIMIVEHAERFGLAQLHQLRGRVGRGEKPSACVLIGAPPTPDAEARLKVMAEVSDGFKLAEKDLEIRGFGDVLGIRQSGMPPFKVAELPRDLDLLALARRDAAAWVEASPGLERPEERLLKRRLKKAHGQWLDLADIA